MSVAAMAPRFSEEEHWHFTPKGIRATLACFAQVEIIPVRSPGGLVRTVNLGLNMFLRNRWLQRIHALTLCPVLNILGLGLERLNLTTNDQFTANYSVRAEKDIG
jgi:hypothetical protein